MELRSSSIDLHTSDNGHGVRSLNEDINQKLGGILVYNMEERRSWNRKIGLGLRTRQSKRSRRRHAEADLELLAPEPPKQVNIYKRTSFALFSNLKDNPPLAQLPPLPPPVRNERNLMLASHSLKTSKAYDLRVNSPISVEEVLISSSRLSLSNMSTQSGASMISNLSLPQSVKAAPLSTGKSEREPEEKTYFPFQSLPNDCKLKVFSYLTTMEKGKAAQVSQLWDSLMTTPGLWSHISFSDFPLICISDGHHNCMKLCYPQYRLRIHKFLTFLRHIRPVLRTLEFKFDIAEDNYLEPLQSVIEWANTNELKEITMNWKETPVRPFWCDKVVNMRMNDVMYQHRRRSRLFVNFFDTLTLNAPNLTTLVLPFDWSQRSVSCLLRLKSLHSLVLEKYFVFQFLSQELLDKLLDGLLQLERLMLEVWTPSGAGLTTFSMSSNSLQYLDISQSRGFYLNSLDMPSLKRFRVARHPWNGPLVLRERITLPCLYDVLVEGAENLEKLNDHYLHPCWQDARYKELDEVLAGICSCRQHKKGWAM